MLKRHKLPLIAFLAIIAVVVAGLGSYALAQTGSNSPAPAVQSDGSSRHVDYDVSLQVAGDLSAVNPELQGLLPLNLEAKGGADIEKTANGPAVKGDLQLGGLDAIVQKLTTGNGSGNGASALGSSVINSFLSDVQFVAIDKDVYVNLGGTWYDTGSLDGHKGQNPAGDNATNDGAKKDKAKADIASAFPGGPKTLLKDVKTVGQENIDGTATTHNTAAVDLDKALTEASTAARNAGKTAQADKLDAVKTQITGAFKTLNVEWWLDGSGKLIQAKLAVDVTPSSLAPLVEQYAGNKPGDGNAKVNADAVLKGITSVTLNATVKFSHFGEDFQISKPDGNIQPLKDLMGMVGGHKGGQDNSSKPANQGGHRGSGTATTTG